jgi:imidazolonepropionase-like amidohydrolase
MSPDRLERFLSGYSSIEHLIGYVAALQVGYDTANIKDEPIALPLDLTKIPALIAATRRAGTWNCPTEVNNEGNGLELGTMQLVTSNIIKIRRQIIKGLQDAGTGLLLGTDAGSLLQKPGLASHWELQALVRAGLTPYQALATGTRNVAVFLGWLDDTGTIAVGKRADLMLLNGNPLMDIQQTMNSAGVMLGGRWLARAEIDRRLSDIKGDDKATH